MHLFLALTLRLPLAVLHSHSAWCLSLPGPSWLLAALHGATIQCIIPAIIASLHLCTAHARVLIPQTCTSNCMHLCPAFMHLCALATGPHHCEGILCCHHHMHCTCATVARKCCPAVSSCACGANQTCIVFIKHLCTAHRTACTCLSSHPAGSASQCGRTAHCLIGTSGLPGATIPTGCIAWLIKPNLQEGLAYIIILLRACVKGLIFKRA
jgi:hypothetical protein